MADTGQPAKAPEPTNDPNSTTPPTGTAATPSEKTDDKPKATVLETGDGEKIAVPVDFPADWREKIAGNDDKELKRLQRMKSPRDLYTSYRNLENKVKKGQDPDPFPEDGSDEEKAEWRKARNIPDKYDGYLPNYTLDGGFVIGEDDKPKVNKFLETMHKEHADPKAVKAALQSYYAIRDEDIAARKQKDEEEMIAARDELRDEMGADYSRNLSVLQGFINSAPEEVKEQLLGARLSDGTALGNHAPTLRWLMDKALEINPAGTVVPGSGAGAMASIETEIADLEKKMENKHSDYWSGPKSESLQARYRQLVEARDKMKQRAA